MPPCLPVRVTRQRECPILFFVARATAASTVQPWRVSEKTARNTFVLCPISCLKQIWSTSAKACAALSTPGAQTWASIALASELGFL